MDAIVTLHVANYDDAFQELRNLSDTDGQNEVEKIVLKTKFLVDSDDPKETLRRWEVAEEEHYSKLRAMGAR